ncbi:MAG: alpha/beta hydrolase [Planctomycetes bacterium]|nr:alpha/beta hydrolase [Planctomycetota bacterium]
MWRVLLLLLCAYGGAVLFGLPPSWPFDVLYAAGRSPVPDGLTVPADGKRRVVVLQHGLWRSAAGMGRLERTLTAAGYEVLNPDYPSTAGFLADHAASLHVAIERRLAAGAAVDELHFVGHSMGGLVIQEYLRRTAARVPTSCVYIAVPHRGAMLCDLRKRWWVFALAMGDKAALQLSPGDPFHQQAIPLPCPTGAIVGTLGAGNDAIPGDDDGTVAVGEATLAGAADTVTLGKGHTAIAIADETAAQVLQFLRHRRFAR